MYKYTKIQGPRFQRNYIIARDKKSTLFSAFSLSRCVEIGHRQSRPVDECSEEKREGLGREKIHTGRNVMAGERENARERNIRCCIYTTTLRKIDRMALFIPSLLLLYVRGETAENSDLHGTSFQSSPKINSILITRPICTQ